MLPSIVEKAGYVIAVTLLHRQGRIDDVAASTAVPDLILGLLFVFLVQDADGGYGTRIAPRHVIDTSPLKTTNTRMMSRTAT